MTRPASGGGCASSASADATGARLLVRPVTEWDSLTDTEQAVAGLVAQGLNNNQVAARMYISTHTVAHHLRQTFRKLSIASRYQLTRLVIEQAADGPAQLALLVASGSGWFRSGAILRHPGQRSARVAGWVFFFFFFFETVVSHLCGPGTVVLLARPNCARPSASA